MARLSPTLNHDVKVISLVCFPHLMSHAYWLVIPPMFPVLMLVFSLNYTEAGAIITVFATATTIAQTPVGFLVDRIGARTVLFGGLALEGVAIGLFGLSTAYWQLLILAAIAGLGHTVFHPADYAILSERVSEERMGRAFSIHSATGYVGFAVAPIFMTGVTALWNWRAAFLLIGIIGLVAAVVLLTQSKTLGNARDTGKSKAARRSEDAGPLELKDGLRLLATFPILMCFLYFVLHQMGGGGVRAFLVVALADMYGTPEVIAALALSAFTVGSVLGILSGGYVADRFGPRVMTAILTLVPAALIIALLGWVEIQGILLISLLTLSGYLIGILIPSRDLLLRSVTPNGSMGKVMGFASTGSNLGGAMIPVVLGFVMDAEGLGAPWVFWISALFVGAAFLTFITAKTKFNT